MTLQTSGAISIGQAMEECGIGLPTEDNAGSSALSTLAGVNPGQPYAWSYWYGKTHLNPINNQEIGTFHGYVDRYLQVSINLQTGAVAPTFVNGDHGPGLRDWSPDPLPGIPNINLYRAWSISMQFVSGANRMIYTVLQQPSPANGFVAVIQWDDNANSGAADNTVGVFLTATP
jgi:hypothetical protein